MNLDRRRFVLGSASALATMPWLTEAFGEDVEEQIKSKDEEKYLQLIDEKKRWIADVYKIRVEMALEQGVFFRNERYALKGDPLTDLFIQNESLKMLTTVLQHYPPQSLWKFLNTITLGENMTLGDRVCGSSQPIGGLAINKKQVFLNVGAGWFIGMKHPYAQEKIDHEIAHLVFLGVSEDGWRKLLAEKIDESDIPPYAKDPNGKDCVKMKFTGEEKTPPGFVHEHGRTNFHEDMATLLAQAFIDDSEDMIDGDEVLGAKLEVVKNIFRVRLGLPWSYWDDVKKNVTAEDWKKYWETKGKESDIP